MSECSCRDHQVVGADERSGAAQARVPFGVDVGGSRIEGQAGEQRAEILGDTPVFLRLGRSKAPASNSLRTTAERAISVRGSDA
jgi:hypothetical protein